MNSQLVTVIICLMVSTVCCKHPSTTLDVDCGNPFTKKPATLSYVGDAKAVYAYNPKGACRFKINKLTGGYIMKINYNNKDSCSFVQSGKKSLFSIKVESRMLHAIFEGGDDEKFLVECSFMAYKKNIAVKVDLKSVYKPYEYLLFSNGGKAASDFKLNLANRFKVKITGKVLESTVVMMHTNMIAKGGEKSYVPIECIAQSEDGKVKVPILSAGCGTGFPFKITEGFTMTKTNGYSPLFKMFRISKNQGVVFKCSFVICTGSCDGSTCKKSSTRKRRSVPRLAYDQQTGLLAEENTGVQKTHVKVAVSSKIPDTKEEVDYISDSPTYITVLTVALVIAVTVTASLMYMVFKTSKSTNT